MSQEVSAKQGGERVLMNYWRSSCSWRVRMVLKHKGLDYKYVPVNLLKAEDCDEKYYTMNPSGVPTYFDIDKADMPLTQSIAIMEFLEERYPDHAVLPRGFHDRAIVRSICSYVGSAIQPLQNLGVAQKVGAKFGEEAKKAWVTEVITEGMLGLEHLLKKHAGTHCFGDTFTMADCCIVPQAYACRRFGVDLAQFPTVSRVLATIESSEVYKATHPDQMPDAVKQ